MIAGLCIDWCITPYICTSLCFSHNSEFVACTYSQMKQIFIYANKAFFGDVYANQTPKEPCMCFEWRDLMNRSIGIRRGPSSSSS